MQYAYIKLETRRKEGRGIIPESKRHQHFDSDFE